MQARQVCSMTLLPFLSIPCVCFGIWLAHAIIVLLARYAVGKCCAALIHTVPQVLIRYGIQRYPDTLVSIPKSSNPGMWRTLSCAFWALCCTS
jgi:hypothetical protein